MTLEIPVRNDPLKPSVSEEHLRLYRERGYYTIDHDPHIRIDAPDGATTEFLGVASETVESDRIRLSRHLVYDPSRNKVIPLTVRGRNRLEDRETVARAVGGLGEGFNRVATLDQSLLVFIGPKDNPPPVAKNRIQ